MTKNDLTKSELYENKFGKKESVASKICWGTIFFILISFLCFRIYWMAAFGAVCVDGTSMYPTLYNNEILIMKYLKFGEKAERGDVIVVDVRSYAADEGVYEKHDEDYYISSFKRGNTTTEFLIKRLIAIEGDSIYCENGTVYLKESGQTEYTILEESYIEKGLIYSFGSREKPYVVGKDEIFFLGDNRLGSLDDRYYEEDRKNSHINGLYKEEDIFATVSDWTIEHPEKVKRIISFMENPLKFLINLL